MRLSFQHERHECRGHNVARLSSPLQFVNDLIRSDCSFALQMGCDTSFYGVFLKPCQDEYSWSLPRVEFPW